MGEVMKLQHAMEMAEALTLDNEHALSTLGNEGDEVAIALYERIIELEALEYEDNH